MAHGSVHIGKKSRQFKVARSWENSMLFQLVAIFFIDATKSMFFWGNLNFN